MMNTILNDILMRIIFHTLSYPIISDNMRANFHLRWLIWYLLATTLLYNLVVSPLFKTVLFDHNLTVISIITFIYYLITIVLSALLNEIIVARKSDQYIINYFILNVENQSYNYLYKILNGSPPSQAYEQNFKYDNIYDCVFVWMNFVN